MEAFLEYIMLNYTWFLGGAIIILLAIIGYYADETNFGQGENKEQKDKDVKSNEIEKQQIQDQPIQTLLENSAEKLQPINQQENVQIKNQPETLQVEPIVPSPAPVIENQLEVQQQSEQNKVVDNYSQVDPINKEVPSTNFEVEFEKFDKEFNEVLPKKDIINDELLEEIDSLSFDKTQKIELTDIPNLDDVELPKIKSLEQEEEDIWKF